MNVDWLFGRKILVAEDNFSKRLSWLTFWNDTVPMSSDPCRMFLTPSIWKGGEASGGNFKNNPERAAEAGKKGGESSSGGGNRGGRS